MGVISRILHAVHETAQDLQQATSARFGKFPLLRV